MTMQMILKARGGYLLASDRQMVDEQATRTALHTEKIIDLPGGGTRSLGATDYQKALVEIGLCHPS